ncbi:hypothetical protein ACOTFF_24885 [Achromobacter xylosoxidans]
MENSLSAPPLLSIIQPCLELVEAVLGRNPSDRRFTADMSRVVSGHRGDGGRPDMARDGSNGNVNINITFSGNNIYYPGRRFATSEKQTRTDVAARLDNCGKDAAPETASQIGETLVSVRSETARPHDEPARIGDEEAPATSSSMLTERDLAVTARENVGPVDEVVAAGPLHLASVGVDETDSSPSAMPGDDRPSALAAVKERARRNETRAVEDLFERALLAGRDGREAMDFLFDLYTGADASATPRLSERVRQASVEVWNSLNEHGQGAMEGDVRAPLKLLIMAGFACEHGSNGRKLAAERLSDVLSMAGSAELLRLTLQEDERFSSLLDESRMVTANELDAYVDKLNRDAGVARFDRSCGEDQEAGSLPEPPGSREEGKGAQWLPGLHPRFVGIRAQPICIRRHWVLFGVDTRQRGMPRAFLFDSDNYLEDRDRAALLAAAKQRLKVSALPLDSCTEKLQRSATHTSNACGVFVAEAMNILAEPKSGKSPGESLKRYSDDFRSLDDYAQRSVVTRRRARLYGEILASSFIRDASSDS